MDLDRFEEQNIRNMPSTMSERDIVDGLPPLFSIRTDLVGTPYQYSCLLLFKFATSLSGLLCSLSFGSSVNTAQFPAFPNQISSFPT